jgi:hypothetical protein
LSAQGWGGYGEHFSTWSKGMATVALHFVYYNFCRVYQTLKATPAVVAGTC